MLHEHLDSKWINGAGKDVSDILRGQIMAMKSFLDLKNTFARLDNLKKEVEEEKVKHEAGKRS